MSLAAVKEPYLLLIMRDDAPLNPREDYDNFGHMNCWHNRYNLGDKHDFEDTNELFMCLIRDSIDADTVIDYVKSGKTASVKLEYVSADKGWEIKSYDNHFKDWWSNGFYEGEIEKNREDIFKSLVDVLSNKDLYSIANEKNIILPLNLYDHSGISMSVSSFIGHAQHAEWDSGQVGWIYATQEDIKKEYGDTSPESMEKAKALLISEVNTYNYFLTDQCYGYRLYKDGKETNSCWGYLCEFSELATEIASNLPESHRDIIDHMQEVTDTYIKSKEYEDYIEELEEMEA